MVFTSTSRRFLTCILTLAGCVGLLSAPQLVQAQQESSPTSAPLASLEEANQLDKQIQELKKRGKYEEAIPIARRELGIREKALGPEHPDVVVSLNTLGELLWRQGEYQEAEQLRKRAELILSKELAGAKAIKVQPQPEVKVEPQLGPVSNIIKEEKQYTHIPVFYGTDRKENLKEHYGGDRGGGLRLGICDVTIPRDHRSANIESPHWWQWWDRNNPEKYVTISNVLELDKDRFFKRMSNLVQTSSEKDAFVFIHGYNTTFDSAAERTAQLAYDLGFKGAPAFFSWPSRGKLTAYVVDETEVQWAMSDLKQFLSDLVAKSGAKKIHLIAHSMGNRALTDALREFASSSSMQSPIFDQVILAAPDIDADTFRKDIAPRILSTANRVTLYASSNDEALAASKEVHGYARAGESGRDRLVIIKGMDTIDVSNVDTSFLGHGYFADNKTVISDVYGLVQELPPDKRNLLPEIFNGLSYWLFRR
jgi:esterase/lipase superfamily enzyme